jgi:hypothetical protein
MQFANLSVSNYTIFLAVLWCLIALHNSKSFVMLATLLAYVFIQAFTPTNFQAFLVISSAYFYLSQSNIRYLSQFRQVFLCFGAVYFLGAIDQAVYYHFEFDTLFDRIQPYLITIINAYVLAALIGGGGKQDAGLIDYITANCVRWLNGLSLLQTGSKDSTR